MLRHTLQIFCPEWEKKKTKLADVKKNEQVVALHMRKKSNMKSLNHDI